MLFRQIVHEDLGCASYLVGDVKAGIAAVIDPQWDIEPYLRLARVHGVRIAHVIETHNHADHVSGHGRLARATGAAIHISDLAEAEYEHQALTDGTVISLGEIEIQALATPGHRPEHTSLVLRDRGRASDPWAVLTGDSLFVGDVARPDLAIEPREGARQIHESLTRRLLSLPDSVEIWPGHLGGSTCGSAGIDHKTSSTIGFERQHNPAAGFDDAEEFVEHALASLGDRPPNVEHVVALNRGPLADEPAAPTPLSPRAVADGMTAGALLVDARTNEQFDEAHIPGAISASAGETGFATKVARVVPPGADLLVVAGSDGYALEAVELLAAVGLRASGFLAGGMTAWRSEGRPVERVELIDANELADRLDDDRNQLVLDVRDEDEFRSGHIPGSVHIPYGELPSRLDELPRDRAIATICSGGKRSGLAASVLLREGFEQVIHVGHGGVGTWRSAGRPVEQGS